MRKIFHKKYQKETQQNSPLICIMFLDNLWLLKTNIKKNKEQCIWQPLKAACEIHSSKAKCNSE